MRLIGFVAVLLLSCAPVDEAAPEPGSGGGGLGGSSSGSGGQLAGTGGVSAGTISGGVGGGGAPGAGAGGTAGNEQGGGASGAGGGGKPGVSSVTLDPTLLSKCQTGPDEAYPGKQKIWCQLDAPDGNYDVSVDLGSDTVAGSSRLAAETRHYFGAEAATAAGEHLMLDFTANVRAEKHDGEQSAPGGILDLTIRGDMPTLRGLGFRPAPTSVTLFVAGDSTVCDWVGSNTSAISEDETGWVQALAQYLKPGIAVANYADSGETAGGFYGKFFPQARTAMKAGDYLFIQFGHNDQKEAPNVDAYKANVMKYVDDARARQVTPVLFTPVARKGNADFAGIDEQARELAEAQQIALVDLSALSFAYYATVPNKDALFVDGTHLSNQGANEVAKLVADAIKASDSPLMAWIK